MTEVGWVTTVIGRTGIEHALGPVAAILKKHGLGVDGIEPLSGAQGANGYACAEFHASGVIRDEASMRAELSALADQIAVDLAMQQLSERQERRLFVFDMDSTLIQGETIDELAKLAGVGVLVSEITSSASGLREAKALEVIERLPLMEGAERLFRTLKARGAKTAILSGGFTFFGAVLKEKVGADYVFANELDVRDGFVTGQVRGRIVDGARKAELLVELAGREGIPLQQVVAVGDGANDLPMLGLAGMGVAFHAKPVVRASARFSMTHIGLDGLLYLLGVPDWEW
jgi:phosphoserine phosphatase